MIIFDSVSKCYGDQTVFLNASFTISQGEKVGLAGRNGSGKSTLFRMICKEENEDAGSITIPKGHRIAFLKQHRAFTQENTLLEAAANLPDGQKECLHKAEEVLFGLGFTGTDLKKAPTHLSSGFQMRLGLAKALIEDADLLLLDEPTNYLDIISQSWLQRFLKGWTKQMIIISHDRHFMDSITDSTMMIHRNQIKKMRGGTEDLYRQIVLEEEVFEKTRKKEEERIEKLQRFIDRFGAKATKASQARSRKKEIDKSPSLQKLSRIHNLDFEFKEEPIDSKILLAAKDLTFSYHPGERPLIDHFSLEVENGGKIGVIGKNGRGKSTLLKLLGGFAPPQNGSIRVSPKIKTGFFGQTMIDKLHGSKTVFEEIKEANPNLNDQDVLSLAGLMMFSKSASNKLISMLSGGERSRVVLAKILARPCNLLLLDEPTHHLDIESTEALRQALEIFSGAFILVTHSEELLLNLDLDHLVVFEEKGVRTVPYGYQDFLDRGGFLELSSSGKKEEKRDVKGEIARLKAEKVQALSPLKQAVKKIEDRIHLLEKDLQQLNEELEKAYMEKSGGQEGGMIHKKIVDCQKKIDSAFDELELAARDLRNMTCLFDDKLNELASLA